MAADTLADSIPGLDHVTKLHRRDSAVYGVSGNLDDCQVLADWYFGPRDHPPKYFLIGDDRPSASLLVLHDDGSVYTTGWGGHAVKLSNGYAATGSGSQYAVGAMFCGASAIKAVEAAARHDINTGGEIDYASAGGEILRFSERTEDK